MTNQNTSTNQNIETEYEYKRIASMDLIDFSQQLQDCIKQGYELVFDNENSPVQLGTLLTCGVRRLVYVAKEESETTNMPVVANATLVTNTAITPKQRKTKVATTAATNVAPAVTSVTTVA